MHSVWKWLKNIKSAIETLANLKEIADNLSKFNGLVKENETLKKEIDEFHRKLNKEMKFEEIRQNCKLHWQCVYFLEKEVHGYKTGYYCVQCFEKSELMIPVALNPIGTGSVMSASYYCFNCNNEFYAR
jgi:hypothetical protein